MILSKVYEYYQILVSTSDCSFTFGNCSVQYQSNLDDDQIVYNPKT